MFDTLTNTVSDALRFAQGKSSINEKNINEAVEKIKMALLEADVNLRVVRRFVNQTVEEALGEKVLRAVDPGQQFVKIVHDKLCAFLGGEKAGLALKGPDTISVILMLGLQGSGKTTTSAKLALKLKNEGRKPLLVACDLVRPAAAEQLAVIADKAGVPVYREDGAGEAAAVYKNARLFAQRNGVDTMIVDTSGRLHVDAEMMAELARLKAAAKPDELLFVSDAMIGQTVADVAKAFDGQIGLTGVILTKFDSDTRGGAALSLKTVTGKPLKFIGTGEKLEDLDVFYPDRTASRILGMGDVVSLVEKARQVIDEKEAAVLQRKIEKENFTLEDYLSQLQAVKKMGAMKAMLDMIPGMQVSEDDVEKADLKTHEVIINSMTKKERANHLIIGPARRTRIARGSGTSVAEVSRLIKKFEKMRAMMKKMSRFSKKGVLPNDIMARMGGRSGFPH
ncbi:MAG: signal recognition particle protein [Spirochaetaceae bacterium]|nr:signal recognition particle protein [Spirochaetaceae bacterium]